MRTTKGNILIIDDEEVVCQVLQRILVHSGYAATTAESGMEALGIFEKQSFDIIIADLNMPGMDGFELIQRVHAIDEDMVIVILTGHASSEAAVKGLKVGAYDFLIKPVDLDLFFPAIERAIERSHLVKENRRYVAQLEEQVAERTKQLAGVNEIHRYIATHVFNIKEGLLFIGKIITRVLNLERCVIYLSDKHGRLLPHAGWVEETEIPHRELPDWSPSSVIDTVCSVPIGMDEGVIQVERAADRKPIRASDLEILKTFIEPIRLVVKFGQVFENIPQAPSEMDVDLILADMDAFNQAE